MKYGIFNTDIKDNNFKWNIDAKYRKFIKKYYQVENIMWNKWKKNNKQRSAEKKKKLSKKKKEDRKLQVLIKKLKGK